MTVIYIDVLFLLNFVVDYILLLASARITGAVFSRIRIAVGAAIGAGYAAALFLPGFEWGANILCKAAVSVLMVLAAFGARRQWLRILLVFYAVSAALGGLVLALQFLEAGGLTVERGVLYTGFDVRLLLVAVILCYVGLRLVFERFARHGGISGDLCTAHIEFDRKSLKLSVLLDTGNTLTDPTDNRPVMVVEGAAMAPLLPAQVDPADPVGSMERLAAGTRRNRFRLLPYRAIGVEYGMLLAVRTDRVVLNQKVMDGLLVALSPTPVSDGGCYQALIGKI